MTSPNEPNYPDHSRLPTSNAGLMENRMEQVSSTLELNNENGSRSASLLRQYFRYSHPIIPAPSFSPFLTAPYVSHYPMSPGQFCYYPSPYPDPVFQAQARFLMPLTTSTASATIPMMNVQQQSPMSPTKWYPPTNTLQYPPSLPYYSAFTPMSSQPPMNPEQILPSYPIPMGSYFQPQYQGPYANIDYSQSSSTLAVPEVLNRTTLQHFTVMRDDRIHQQHLPESVVSGNALEGCAPGGNVISHENFSDNVVKPAERIAAPQRQSGENSEGERTELYATTSVVSRNPNNNTSPETIHPQPKGHGGLKPGGKSTRISVVTEDLTTPMSVKKTGVATNKNKKSSSEMSDNAAVATPVGPPAVDEIARSDSIPILRKPRYRLRSANASPVISKISAEKVKATPPGASSSNSKRKTNVKKIKKKPSNSLGIASTSSISSNPSDVPVVFESQSENVKATLPGGLINSQMKTKGKKVKRKPSNSVGHTSNSNNSANPSGPPVVSIIKALKRKAITPSGTTSTDAKIKTKVRKVIKKPSKSVGTIPSRNPSNSPGGHRSPRFVSPGARSSSASANDSVESNSDKMPALDINFSTEKETEILVKMRSWVLNKAEGETVLHRAATLGLPDIVCYCMSHHIMLNPNCINNHGLAPLHEACINGHEKVVEALLTFGAGPSKRSPGGVRPLHLAASNGHFEIVKLLLSRGADPNQRTERGESVMDMAVESVKPLLLPNAVAVDTAVPTSNFNSTIITTGGTTNI